jgi:acetylornithine deacetylase/succinyl-diaminopimelate desuccinylase-like protein
LRGGFNFTLKLHTGKNNLHSGLAGGAVPSASHELSRLIGKIYNSKNQVTIPHFYDGVVPVTSQIKKQNSLIQTESQIKKTMGVKKLLPE